jgi:rhamnose transport system ATP-binding protein
MDLSPDSAQQPSVGGIPPPAPDRDVGGLGPVSFEVEGIFKSFGTSPVLRDVSLRFHAGEVHAVVGENGAGKSTLAKIMAGAVVHDRGALRIDGVEHPGLTPHQAQLLGVTMIFQEPTLFPDLSVAENIFVGRQPRRPARPWLDRGVMLAKTRALLDAVGSSIPAGRLVRGLSLAEMQMVEIAAAMSFETRLLIVDEPTASLTPTEVEHLFGLLRSLCANGAAVLFIGHRLEEVFAISDRITVLRDGEVVGSRPASEFTRPELVAAMVGRKAQAEWKRVPQPGPSKTLLEVDGLSRSGVFKDISFRVGAGEIVGMAGLVGAGRSEIARATFGVDAPHAGSVAMSGTPLRPGDPSAAIKAGLAYVPEDRKLEGLAVQLPVYENLSILLTSIVGRLGWLRRRKERSVAADWFRRLDVRARSVAQPVAELSGGNQQKVVLAKWLATDPKVLILDEPTRGVDVGAKGEIHKLIDSLAQQGLGILVISSDLHEILALSDRILVISEGRMMGELPGDSSSEEVLGLAVGSRDVAEPTGAPSR